MTLRSKDFESFASAIPPPGQAEPNGMIMKSAIFFNWLPVNFFCEPSYYNKIHPLPL